MSQTKTDGGGEPCEPHGIILNACRACYEASRSDDALYVAEKLSVACECTCHRPVDSAAAAIASSHLCACNGTGLVWPLREACWCMAYPGLQPPIFNHGEAADCQGRSWLPITDYDIVTAAVRAKGWCIDTDSNLDGEGDWVGVYTHTGDLALLGKTHPSEGLRGMAAINRALRRALEE